jgi:hypothetical protein
VAETGVAAGLVLDALEGVVVVVEPLVVPDPPDDDAGATVKSPDAYVVALGQ